MITNAVTEAISKFNKEFPGMRVIGYWKNENGYILNTKRVPEIPDIIEPGQFIVTNDGRVYGTNPVLSKLNSLEYYSLI